MVLVRNLRPPTEGVRREEANTTAVLSGQVLGCGTLYVAETRLSWFDGSGMGFSLEYPSISLHAISRDVSAYPEEHLYVMVNGKLGVESMFSAMCECQALHPDPEDEDSDNDFEGEEYNVEEAEYGHADIPTFYTCEEGLSSLTQEGQATLERLEGMLAQSVAQQYHMAGVRTEESKAEFEDGMEVDAEMTEAGQFEDADVEH
uniref:Methylosome subunit pICln n=1 Tax=Oryzias melastigma TaxID=30732 RepID=A0A3B3CUX3_ORYME